MNKPRVLMSGPLPPAIGGMSSVIGMLAQSSLASRCELTLFETGKTTPPNRTLLRGIKARLGVMRSWWKHLASAEIAHIHTCSGLTYFLDGLLLLLARSRGVRVVLHVHGGRFDGFLDGLSPLAKLLARGLARRANVVIALSEDWRERLAARLPGAKLKVVSNGVAIPVINLCNRNGDDEPQFLFLGNLSEGKGVPELLHAVARSSGQWRVLLAGGEEQPGYVDWVRGEVERLRIFDRVQILGPVVGDDKTQLLARVSGFVLPSRAEGLPIALLEAMAMELPAVVTAVGAMPEVVRDGVEGIVIPPGDIKALADALDRLARCGEERARMGKQARETCESRFGVERMVDALIDIYVECVSRSCESVPIRVVERK